jgi:uncharacterized protein
VLVVFIATFLIMLVLVLLMSIGYLIQRKKMSSSCGGISSLGMKKVCDCDEPCDKKKQAMADAKTKTQASAKSSLKIEDKNRIL